MVSMQAVAVYVMSCHAILEEGSSAQCVRSLQCALSPVLDAFTMIVNPVHSFLSWVHLLGLHMHLVPVVVPIIMSV